VSAQLRGRVALVTGAGRDLHERFIAMHKSGTLLTPEQSASALLERLRTGGTGQIWNVSD
jgi:hypothetical protein